MTRLFVGPPSDRPPTLAEIGATWNEVPGVTDVHPLYHRTITDDGYSRLIKLGVEQTRQHLEQQRRFLAQFRQGAA